MDMLTNDNWLLSVGTFLPLLGAAILVVVPRSQEAACDHHNIMMQLQISFEVTV